MTLVTRGVSAEPDMKLLRWWAVEEIALLDSRTIFSKGWLD